MMKWCCPFWQMEDSVGVNLWSTNGLNNMSGWEQWECTSQIDQAVEQLFTLQVQTMEEERREKGNGGCAPSNTLVE